MNFIGGVPTVHNTLFLSLKIPESFSPPTFFFFLDVGIVTSIARYTTCVWMSERIAYMCTVEFVCGQPQRDKQLMTCAAGGAFGLCCLMSH